MQSFILANAHITARCIKAIEQAVADTPHKVMVTIGIDDDKTRTLAQNRLYWLWVGIIADWQGLDKDSCHTALKRKFLAPILAKTDGEYGQMFDSVKACRQYLTHTEYENLATTTARLLSTTKTSSKQMKEYLDDVEKFYAQHGLVLPIPQDLEWIR